MAKSTAKLKAIEPEPDPARQPLIDAFARIAELEAAVAANETEQREAREKIKATETLITETTDTLKNAHPSEKRRLRNELAAAAEDLEDWRDHLGQLQRQGGSPPYLDAHGSLSLQIKLARGDINIERARFLKQHPDVNALFEKVVTLRGELLAATANALLVARVGGVPSGMEDWERVSMQSSPAPNAALKAWIEALAIDPAAELDA